MKNMKKKVKNGFTLIELLAVIVVLAVIMIIAIPSIMDTMNKAKKNTFVMYMEKVVTAVQTQYAYDSQFGPSDIKKAGVYAYDIKTDINVSTTGEFEGYVIVYATDLSKVEYKVWMRDQTYQIVEANVTKTMPNSDSQDIKARSASVDTEWKTIDTSCASGCTKRSSITS